MLDSLLTTKEEYNLNSCLLIVPAFSPVLIQIKKLSIYILCVRLKVVDYMREVRRRRGESIISIGSVNKNQIKIAKL